MMIVDCIFVDPYHRLMKKLLVVFFVMTLLLLVLFRVEFDFQFSMPEDIEVPDAGQEALYQQCVDERDAEIHRVVFGTIDNPDVQREILSTQKDIAKAECRREYPERMTTERRPFRLKLIDLQFR
jgi:hypothetical protein